MFLRTSTHPPLRRALFLALAIALLSAAAYGQGTASMVGTVIDPTGAAIPGAKVTITNTDTGLVRSTEANATGNYAARELPIGHYEVQVESAGFKVYKQTGITLSVNDTVRVDAALQVGETRESITVEANAVQVQSETNEISQTITDTMVDKLATNGRNVIQLAALVPGAASQIPDFDNVMAQTQNRAISYNGQRNDHNNWIINGGEAYDRGGGGILIVSPSQDSVQEFKVMTSNFAADLGQSSGGMITMATKAGTKDYHGGAWEYLRNDALNANTWAGNHSLVNGRAAPIPELRYNTFGFNLGGPVPFDKQKTFFFYNMEWRRRINGSQIVNTNVVPRPMIDGDFSSLSTPITVPIVGDPAYNAKLGLAGLTPGANFPGNKIPASLLNANAKTLVAAGLFPGPNTSAGTYIQSTNQISNYREENARLDHRFNDKLNVMASLIYDNGIEKDYPPLWAGGSFATAGSVMAVPSWAGVVHVTHTISPTLLNEASFNLNGNNISITNLGLWKKPSGYNVKNLFAQQEKLPGFNIGAPYNQGYNPGWWPWFNTWRSWQWKDDVSWVRGRHNMKFGGSYMYTHKWQQFQTNAGGSFNFGTLTGNSFADFMLGLASSYTEPVNVGFVDISNHTISAYALDDWRVNNRLTLNLGLRWEGLPHAYDSKDNASNFYPGLYSTANAARYLPSGALDTSGPGFQTGVGPVANFPFYMNGIGLAGKNGIPRGLVNNTWNTFAPRVGFAFDLTGRQKTILRAGSGLFYERLGGNEMYNLIQNSVPFAYSANASSVYLDNPATTWTNGQTAAIPYFPSNIWMLDRGYKNPTSLQWSFGIQQQITQNSVLSVSYVGNSNFHQTQGININMIDPNNTALRTAICGKTACGYTGDPVIANLYRPYYGWGTIANQQTGANSNYNSLQVSFRLTEWKHLTVSEAYTWSHAFDVIDGELFATVNNPFNTSWDYASAGYDRRHISITSFIYQIPLFNTATGIAKTALGGWQLSGILMLQTGNPFSIGPKFDQLGFGGGTTNRADVVAPISYPKTVDAWFSTSSFAQPAPLKWGTSSRDSLVGPGRNNWNMAMFKAFQFTEKMKFEFRAESFNAFNHTQFTNPVTNMNAKNFGALTNTSSPRVWQLGAKILF